MRRGSFVGKRAPMKKVSDKVRAAQPEFDAVYDHVDRRSEDRCEVVLVDPPPTDVSSFTRLPDATFRCKATSLLDHHHTRTPRRSWHAPAWIMRICRRHHDMVTASYKVGRLLTVPNGDGTFTCSIERREGKWQ